MKTDKSQGLKTFEIYISDADKKATLFAYILLHKKPALGAAFEKEFQIKFETKPGYGEKDPVIAFTAHSNNENNVRNGFSLLQKEFSSGKHITAETIAETAAKVYMQDNSSNDNSAGAQFATAAKRGTRGAPKPEPHDYVFQPKNDGQKNLAEKISHHDITFGIGPAGTGKTHVAIAMAVEALKKGEVDRIVLARPAVGSGKDLGALPGSLEDKLSPYMRPLYDELQTTLGFEQTKKGMEEGYIEIIAVELLQGRTLKNAFIVVDEAQNTTREQMELTLTRMGEGSRMVVAGSLQQILLANKGDSGLSYALEALEGIEGVAVQRFENKDIVRHAMVQRICDAFDKKKGNKPESTPVAPKAAPVAPAADAAPPAAPAAPAETPQPHPTRRRPRPTISGQNPKN